MTAIQEVRTLLNEIRFLANHPKIEKCSDQIEVLCRAYMDNEHSEGLAIGLTPGQAPIFDLLLKRRGQVVRRDSLMDVSHPGDTETQPKIVDVQMSHIRERLIGTGYEIETIWGVGYRMKLADVQKQKLAA